MPSEEILPTGLACRDLVDELVSTDESLLSLPTRIHVSECLRCQAELASYTQVPNPYRRHYRRYRGCRGHDCAGHASTALGPAGKLRAGNPGAEFDKAVLALVRVLRGVAQLVEHRSPKPAVAGSSPAAPAWHSRRSGGVVEIRGIRSCR